MITGLALIIVLGTLSYYLFEKLNMPGLLGLLFLGMAIGPYGLNLLDDNMLLVSGELRKIALVIILLRAGLGLAKDDLVKVGSAAIKLSILPCLLEGAAVIFFAFYFLDFNFAEAGVLAFIIAAVSPAVIVPHMLKLKENGYGKNKKIPTLILAGASVDDIIAITLFTTFISLYFGKSQSLLLQILGIPISIILGVLCGLLVGFVVLFLIKRFKVGYVKELLLVFGLSMLILTLEDILKGKIAISSYLGVMAVGYYLLAKAPEKAREFALGFNNIWRFAELCLFVLIGATVNVGLAINSGIVGIALILCGLIFRSLGVWLSLIGTNLNLKEKIFTNISYLPKATVQAAIGAIPLSMGTAHGDYILALAVLSIVLTAPVGAFLMDLTYSKFLVKGQE